MINGIILINKEKGKTSRDMASDLGHIFHMKKIGHTGTLDPLATGILVMCLGRYTKMVDKLSSLKKEYVATIKVGLKTDTLDITGNVLERKDYHIDKTRLLKVLNDLIGDYHQVIPIYSAKKVNGKKLYEYARSGQSVKLPENDVYIYDMNLLEIKNDTFKIKCMVSKGTYIRSLIQTICDNLGIIGTMEDLIRTKQGDFSLENAYTISDIKSGNYKVLQVKDVLNYQVYALNENEYLKAKNGNKLNILSNEKYLILTYNEREIAIYQKVLNEYQIDVMLDSQVL